MKKNIFILNLILLVLLLVGDVCYILFGGLWLKTLTSLMFVAIGLINLIYAIKVKKRNFKFAITLFVGLVFAMAGDIVLNIHFIGGAILFAVGHVFFYIAYNFIEKFKFIDLLYTACVFIPALAILLFVPILNYGSTLMQIICILYTLVISFMVGKAISIYVSKKSFANLFVLLGSIFFFFSDAMLLFAQFSNVSVVFGILCLATYYPAEFLLAYSIFKKANCEKQTK